MADPQRRQKIPFFIFFLTITLSMVLFGLLAPDDQFTKDEPRSKAIFLGVVLTITSTLWFFVGSIDWSDWNRIKKKMGGKVAEENPQEKDER